MGKTSMLYVDFNTRWRRTFLGLAVLFTLIIIIKSLMPATPTLSISNADKVAHMLAYFVLGTVTLPAFAHVKPFIIWLGLCLFGASIEILQGLLNAGRTFDFMDGVANALGALLAIAGWVMLTRFAKLR